MAREQRSSLFFLEVPGKHIIRFNQLASYLMSRKEGKHLTLYFTAWGICRCSVPAAALPLMSTATMRTKPTEGAMFNGKGNASTSKKKIFIQQICVCVIQNHTELVYNSSVRFMGCLLQL